MNLLFILCSLLWTNFQFDFAQCLLEDMKIYPIAVRVNLEINDILFVDDKSEKIALKIKLISEWKHPQTWDKSDSIEETTLNLQSTINQFNPAIFVDTVEIWNISREIIQPIDDGKFRQIRILLVTLKCKMYFDWLPVDIQRCSFVIRSSNHDKHILYLDWANDGEKKKENNDEIISNHFGDDVVVVVDGSAQKNSVNFSLISINRTEDGDCQLNADFTEWSCLRVVALFQRNHHDFLVSYVIPTAMMTILSWLSLFCRSSSIRVTILITCATSSASLMYDYIIRLSQINISTFYYLFIILLFFVLKLFKTIGS